MKTTSKIFVMAFLCTTSAALWASVLVEYDSGVLPALGAAPAANPTEQGWVFDSGTVSGNQYAAGYDSGNGGWRTVDGTSTAPAFYQKSVSETTAASMIYGWTYSVTLSLDSDAIGSAGGFVDGYYLPPNNGRQKDIHLWVETVNSKSFIMQLTVDADSNLWGNDGTTNHPLTTDGSAYDNFKTLTIVFDGNQAVLSCGTDSFPLAETATHTQNRVVFGAVSSANEGSAIWNRVKLTGSTPDGDRKARLPEPLYGAVDVPVTTALHWSSPLGLPVASYDMYMDPNQIALSQVDSAFYSLGQTSEVFDPDGDLEYGQTYYWRVDVREPNEAIRKGDIWSFTTLSPNPKITTQPVNLLLFAGETATFSVMAMNPFSGDDSGMKYQWYKVGAPDTAVGGDSPVLTMDHVTIADAGQYYCVVTVTSPPQGVISNPAQSDPAALRVKQLLGRWEFEDNLDDSSGNGYPGTAVGAPVFAAFPTDPSRAVSGKALHCTAGGPDYVEVPAAVLDGVDTQITLSLWTYGISQPNEGEQHTLLATDDSGAVVFSMMIPHPTARIWTRIGNPVDGTDGWYEGASAPNSWFNGKWNHWVMAKDSEAGILRIYCNGRLWLENTSASMPVYGATKFYIGGGTEAGAFGGYIDDVRVYNYVLTEEEIAAIHPRPMLPDPEDGQANVMYNTALSWTPGDNTSSFTVYCSDQLSSDPNVWLVNPITVTGLTEAIAALPVSLKLGTTYYWYVEECNDASELVWTGDLWDFSVRELVADIDDDSAIGNEDLVAMAARWTDDVRGLPEDVIIDACIYDPNNTNSSDTSSYAHYWDTYWTYTGGEPGGTTGGNNLYGHGYCEAVEEPNKAIAWHYDTPSSSGKTDTDFIYWHRERPRLALSQYKELRMEVRAVPGSALKDPWWAAIDADDDAVEYVIPVGVLADNQWHDIVIPLDSLAGIADMDNMEYIHAGIWGGNISGTWYIRNMRVINKEGTVICLPMYYIPEDLNFNCIVDLEDLAILAGEWLMDARNL
ncbi:MAG: immunoglobulin domain-containing protein [Sedimentisphaerales bacterium]|nr:immunoglobulin domain-containing protein [Sedimentisphaerales bacterium]